MWILNQEIWPKPGGPGYVLSLRKLYLSLDFNEYDVTCEDEAAGGSGGGSPFKKKEQ